MGIRKSTILGRSRGVISVVSTASSDSDGTFNSTDTHNLPSSIVAGNLLLLIVFNGIGTGAPLTTPSGWTLLTSAFGNAAAFNRFSIYYKTATGSEGSTVVISTDGNSSLQVSTAYQISGAGTINIQTNLSDGDPPASTTVAATTNLFIAGSGAQADSAGTGYTAAPTNYTGFLEGTYSPSGNSGHPTMGTAHRLLAAASDNPGTFTTTGAPANPCSFTLVIEPA